MAKQNSQKKSVLREIILARLPLKYLIAFLVAFSFSSFLIVLYNSYYVGRSARDLRIICQANLKHLGTLMRIYADNNDGLYPASDKWCDRLMDQFGANKCKTVFVCPAVGEARCTYAMNPNANPNSAPDMVLLFETHVGWNQHGGLELLTTGNHEGKGCNILFEDGSVKFIGLERIAELKWKQD